jgi:hypothetical protein
MRNTATVAIVTMMIGAANDDAKRIKGFRDVLSRANADPISVAGGKVMTDEFADDPDALSGC